MPQANIRRYLKHGTLPQLRVFEASARLGSFARAAEELHMAPPTASVQIKKLTETIGLPLFEQVGKRIYLTDAGRRLYDGLQRRVSRARLARRDARRHARPGHGPSAPRGHAPRRGISRRACSALSRSAIPASRRRCRSTTAAR